MPYATIGELPDNVESLPKHAKEIYMKAFNSAFEQYKDRGKQREALAHQTAWAAVEKSYKKENGEWVVKEAVHPHGGHLCTCPKCEEEISVAEDVKCNTQECPECGTVMRAKEIGERRESMNISDDNKKNLLQSALVTEYKIKPEQTIPKNLVIDEVFADKVIYDVDGQLYETSYELDEKGIATFGDPKKVISTRVFSTMESLRTTYSEIIQEAGKRNATLDAARVKKIVELCQELLSTEEPEEKKTKEALKEADKTLVWLREQAVMKTEDGLKFPASAFAYVPDIEKASSWKLRLWEDLTKKVTKAQLSRAAAALSPGGFRGQKVAIPSANLSEVKRKIRGEYRKLDVEEADIPRWVKETETRERILNFTPLTEATFDKGRATVIVIKAGFNSSEDRYYPAEMLKRDYKVFEGQKMYADHPTDEEDKARPERSIKDWVATLTEVTCDEKGIVTGVAEIVEPWLMQKLASLRDKEMLSEMGISINAIGSASKGTIEGKETLVIEKLVAARSVDFVTEPGAGGIVTFYESDRKQDIDLIELSDLKGRRPDLLKLIETNVRAEITKEVKKAMENEEKITELEGQITELTKERDTLKETKEKAEKDKAKAEAQAVIKEAVDKAKLPDAAKERLIERYKDAETAEGIEEAIKSEVDYIAKLSESGKVKGLGATQVSTEKDKEALKESFKASYIAEGKTEEEAEKLAETAAKGR